MPFATASAVSTRIFTQSTEYELVERYELEHRLSGVRAHWVIFVAFLEVALRVFVVRRTLLIGLFQLFWYFCVFNRVPAREYFMKIYFDNFEIILCVRF